MAYKDRQNIMRSECLETLESVWRTRLLRFHHHSGLLAEVQNHIDVGIWHSDSPCRLICLKLNLRVVPLSWVIKSAGRGATSFARLVLWHLISVAGQLSRTLFKVVPYLEKSSCWQRYNFMARIAPLAFWFLWQACVDHDLSSWIGVLGAVRSSWLLGFGLN